MHSAKVFTAASILQLFIAAGHSVGHFAMPRPANETEARLIEFMSTYHKQIAGGSMTILNSYDGLNMAYALFFFSLGTVNFYLIRSIPNVPIMKRLSLINAAVMAIGLIIASIFFFWIPISYFAICLILFSFASVIK